MAKHALCTKLIGYCVQMQMNQIKTQNAFRSIVIVSSHHMRKKTLLFVFVFCDVYYSTNCILSFVTASGIFGVRHMQAFLLFLGLTLAYAMRVNLSVAIVAITDRHAANPDFAVRAI